MLDCSCRSLANRGSKSNGAALWNNNTVCSAALSGSNNRAKVMRVFYPVKKNDKWLLATFFCICEDFLNG
jgi:hypothetical protein